MIKVSIHEAQTNLSSLLARVEGGQEEIIICRNGRPVAKLVAMPSQTTDPLRKNPRLGPVVFNEDPCAPLDEHAWPEELR